MRFFCQKSEFFQALSIVQKAINTHNTLPVLGNILLKTEGQKVYLSATNLEIAISTSFSATVKNEGAITVPARLIVNSVSFLKEGEIEVFLEDGESIGIFANGSKTKMKGISAEDFPPLPKVQKEFTVEIEESLLKRSIERTVFCCSASSIRPVLSGALFWVTGKEMRLVATDSYRLGEQKITLSESLPEFKCIIPARTLQELSRILSSEKGDKKRKVNIIASKNQIVFQSQDTEISSRLIEGNFPDYERIIPKERKSIAVLAIENIILGIKRVGIFAKENNNNIRLSLTEKSVVITTDDTEIGNDISEIPAEISGPPIEVALNAQYLLDILQNISDDTLELSLTEKLSPLTIQPKSDMKYVHIIMPLKI
ncbi:MAG: DNA polymerase III subunit beta [Candidatus Peregrinibacteria bacterium]